MRGRISARCQVGRGPSSHRRAQAGPAPQRRGTAVILKDSAGEIQNTPYRAIHRRSVAKNWNRKNLETRTPGEFLERQGHPRTGINSPPSSYNIGGYTTVFNGCVLACKRLIPRSQRSYSVALRAKNSATSGWGKIRKVSSSNPLTTC